TEQEIEDVLDEVFRKYTERQAVKRDNGNAFVEYSMAFGPDLGITLCGEMDKNGFHQEYYFPYFRGTGVSSHEDLIVEKHGARESYAGVMEDARVGISLIFYVQNAVAYKKACINRHMLNQTVTTTFSGLADKGVILFPVCKSEEQVQRDLEAASKRNNLIAAARKGDEEAIESLTLEDMDMYSMISQRIQQEDLFSVVDTFIMPFGMECDQYQIMGEIKNVEPAVNEYTKEKLYFMTISCNDIVFDICINQKDLLGEPEEGRRFKGVIWMQGYINFEKGLD
ncbi:MAG: DUF3881 family protein, partial [Oscillospiraceae bacterium]|nr:DUF3881 family protein [Oscillospiraceae bacterium]